MPGNSTMNARFRSTMSPMGLWCCRPACRADALTDIAESYLAHGPTASAGDRYQVMLHVSAETLVNETWAGDAEDGSYIEDGAHVSAETSRRLCCDAAISVLQSSDPKAFGKRLPFIDENSIQAGNPSAALHCGYDGVQFANTGSAGGAAYELAADDAFVHIAITDFQPAARHTLCQTSAGPGPAG